MSEVSGGFATNACVYNNADPQVLVPIYPWLRQKYTPLMVLEDFGDTKIPACFERPQYRCRSAAFCPPGLLQIGEQECQYFIAQLLLAYSSASVGYEKCGVIVSLDKNKIAQRGLDARKLRLVLSEGEKMGLWQMQVGTQGRRTVVAAEAHSLCKAEHFSPLESHENDAQKCMTSILGISPLSNAEKTVSSYEEEVIFNAFAGQSLHKAKRDGTSEIIGAYTNPSLVRINQALPRVDGSGGAAARAAVEYTHICYQLPGKQWAGRIYNGIQQWSSAERANIRLDGKPCGEWDLKCSHLNAAYIIETGRPFEGDVYDLGMAVPAAQAKMARKAIKVCINAWLNAKNAATIQARLTALQGEQLMETAFAIGLAKKTNGGGFEFFPATSDRTKALEFRRDLKWAASVLAGETKGSHIEALAIWHKQISRVIPDHAIWQTWLFQTSAATLKAAILRKHAVVKSYFGTGWGMTCMGFEGAAAISCMSACVEAGLTVPLNVHDSMVIPLEEAEQTLALWRKAWCDLIGGCAPIERKW